MIATGHEKIPCFQVKIDYTAYATPPPVANIQWHEFICAGAQKSGVMERTTPPRAAAPSQLLAVSHPRRLHPAGL
ncbi:MAG: hypothetical protein ACXWH1_14980, partial [Thermoanaerobaculia bacterium]